MIFGLFNSQFKMMMMKLMFLVKEDARGKGGGCVLGSYADLSLANMSN